MDLGNCLAYWVEKDDPDAMQVIRTMPTNLEGAMTRQEIVDYYGKKTCRDTEQFDFYYCFGLFRLAVIAQQIYYRYFISMPVHKLADVPALKGKRLEFDSMAEMFTVRANEIPDKNHVLYYG